jgi:hypothetical protein
MESRINDILLVKPEEIAIADSLLFVYNFTFVRHLVANLLTNILNDDVVASKIIVSEQSISMNLARTNLDPLRLGLTHSVFHGNWQVTFLVVDSFTTSSTPLACGLSSFNRICLPSLLSQALTRGCRSI